MEGVAESVKGIVRRDIPENVSRAWEIFRKRVWDQVLPGWEDKPEWNRSREWDLANRFEKNASKRVQKWLETEDEEVVVTRELAELQEIAYEGALMEKSLIELAMPRVIPYTLYEQRQLAWLMQFTMLDYYGNSPEFARSLVLERVSGGHGSTSASLMSVMQHGLRPQRYLDERNILIASGEHFFSGSGFSQDYTSFVLWHNKRGLREYAVSSPVEIEALRHKLQTFNHERVAQLHRPYREGALLGHKRDLETLKFLERRDKTDEELELDRLIRLGFPVAYMTSLYGLNEQNTRTVKSDVGHEFIVRDGRDASELPIILVPGEHIQYVEDLGNRMGWNGRVFDLSVITDR